MNIEISRIYQNKDMSGAIRILVDRLWPRGISKEKADLAFWFKEWAPSNNLRKEFHQKQISWSEFRKKYEHELSEKKEMIQKDLEELDKRKTFLLLFGAKDEERNHAVLLKGYLENL
ncbi:DUF488 domain-containing protein [Salegentibacter sp. F14]